MPVDPPPYEVNPDALDEDQHPTGAWTIGEHLDPDIAALLKRYAESHD